ncbi:MAG: methylenetetrahydrofolate reductase [Eubacteriales bacterium]|jgi:methylenetetrahydrofolate reductase (NADPH)
MTDNYKTIPNVDTSSDLEHISHLQKVFASGEFAITAEIGPPRGADASHVEKSAGALRGIVHAANVTDNQTAIVRMSSIAAAYVGKMCGVETIVQMTCRDRNRIAIQSDLLGAYALGLRNLLCLSGDHQSFGDHPQSKNVYDLDSIQLIKMVHDMKSRGVFVNGKKGKHMPKFFIGTTINPFADPEELQLVRLRKKINAGAQFVQTQAVYDIDRFEKWMEKVRRLGIHKEIYIQAGILVNKSLRSMEMTRKVSGMSIPDNLVERMAKAEDAQEEGIKIALELIERLCKIEGLSGIHIMAVGWEKIVPTIVQRAGLLSPV